MKNPQRIVTCHMGSHRVTCHQTQGKRVHHNPRQIGRYSIYLPRRDERLSTPRLSVGRWVDYIGIQLATQIKSAWPFLCGQARWVAKY